MKKVLWALGALVFTVAAYAAADRALQVYKLIFREAGGANVVNVQPPTLAADYTITLPTTDGNSGEVLSTDGSGTLSWTAPLTNPMNSVADIIVGGAAGAATRLAAGSSGTALTISGTTHSYQVPAKFGEVQLNDQAGYGSTATKIPYYTAATVSSPNGIFTVGNGSTNGAFVTFLRPALVTVAVTMYSSSPGVQIGCSLNGATTTNIYADTDAHRKCYANNIVVSGVGYSSPATGSFVVTTNDVVRPHTDGTACGDVNSCAFYLSAIALPPF